MEVARVERDPPDRLVDLSQLGDRERLWAEQRCERGVLELRAGPLETVAEDRRVVERQPALLRQHLVDGDPVRGGSVAAGDGVRQVGSDGEVGDGNDAHPRIALRSTVGSELLEMHGKVAQAGLLSKLTCGSGQEVLVRPDEAARQGPAASVWRDAPPDQQHREPARADRQHDEVNRDRDRRVALGMRRHPLVHPMLAQLLWVDSKGRTLRWADGTTTDSSGKQVISSGDLRVAHPVDLLAETSWVAWQERLFDEARKQPFKQIFRELYTPTEAEKATPVSDRYEGHQLQPRQALALLGSRGWLTDREGGDTSRVFHRHGYVVRVEFQEGFLSPQEADLPTVGGVYFTKRGERFAQPLANVPAVVFSEAMRDLDLVVSVAHAGGVDPEATASTTEMRAALVRETARLLKLFNLEVKRTHVIVQGKLGEYSIHLGSAVVHRRPGGSVCIVPVGSQHRGRLFLPFADDDPKTAEVVSKVVLLARDHEIKNPSILEQLRG